MILRTTGKDMAEQAVTGGYVDTPYSKLDCQAFVEQVLKDIGVRKADGTPYNWKGSNSMWRTHITWKGTIEETSRNGLSAYRWCTVSEVIHLHPCRTDGHD